MYKAKGASKPLNSTPDLIKLRMGKKKNQSLLSAMVFWTTISLNVRQQKMFDTLGPYV